MNIVKGLIIKDLLQLKSYRKTLVMFILIFGITAMTQEINGEMGGMIIIMLTLGLGMFSIATFSYDDMAKADKYMLTLPVTRKDIILSKYILVILSTTIGAILGIIASVIITLIINRQMQSIQELILLATGSIFGIGVVEAIQIPCIYKFGVEKGRIQIAIVIAIIAFLFGGIFFIAEKLSIRFNISFILNDINKIEPVIMVFGIAIIYYISFKISNMIYSKKEI